jgi:pantetheine-phosphate adenylyltransferase
VAPSALFLSIIKQFCPIQNVEYDIDRFRLDSRLCGDDVQQKGAIMNNIILYPGTFDPVTNGHIDIISRVTDLFDEVIVAVGVSSKKNTLFSLEQRVALAERCLSQFDNVSVTGYEGLTVDLALEVGANIILRGLRTGGDFEYESQLNWMNQQLAPELETIYLAPTASVAGISSTLVKEVARYGGDYEHFVPAPVAQALEDAFA